jgi:hypothetical protein
MMIGGEDVIFSVPSQVPAAEVALRRLRRLWPDALIRDPDEGQLRPVRGPWASIRGVGCRELLVYRDAAAAISWDRDGMTPGNADFLICLIVGEANEGEAGRREVTIVCNERTRAIEQVLDDLTVSFEDFEAAAETRELAA